MNRKERRQLRRAVEREQERSLTNMEDAGEEVQAEAGPSTSNMESQDLLKLRARMEYEDKYRAHFYIATLTSEHEEKMKEKDAIIQRLRKEKSNVYSGLQEKARQSVRDEIEHQTTANSFLRGQVENIKTQNQVNVQPLLEQIAILKQDLKKEQEEKESLKSSLETSEAATAAVLEISAEQLDKQKNELDSEVSSLKKALDNEKKKVEALERERQQLTTEVSGLKRALRDYQNVEQEKVGLQSTVKDLRSNLSQEKRVTETLRSKVNELSHKTQEQEETSRALNQKLETVTNVFRAAIQRCQTAMNSAVAQKDHLATIVDNTNKEMEALKLKHSEEVSSEQEQRRLLQEKIQELSEALSASDQNNTDLEKQRLELQEALREKEQDLKEALREKEQDLKEALREKEQDLKEALSEKEKEKQEALREKEEEKQEALREKEQDLKEALSEKEKEKQDALREKEEELQSLKRREKEVVLLWLLSKSRGVRGPGSNMDQDTVGGLGTGDWVRADPVSHRPTGPAVRGQYSEQSCMELQRLQRIQNRPILWREEIWFSLSENGFVNVQS
uniref:Uncharacterized protein n=1 Tax=Knipowitschia caucasica TaxID=637954 RepID=A0AAV2L4E1_KNICA